MTSSRTRSSIAQERAGTILTELHRTLPVQTIGQLRLPELRVPDLRLGGWIEAMQDVGASIVSALQPYHDALHEFSRAMAPLRERLSALAAEGAKCRRLEEAGWLPHSTTPFDQLEDEDLQASEISTMMERHYRDNWTSVCEVFLADLDGYDIDDEAKDAFREALHMHGQGYHRAACRLLFPEIERVSRTEIHGGTLEGITSQRQLGRKIGELTPCAMGDGLRGMAIYRKLVGHIYAPVKSEDALRRVLSDPVPNRHVTLHGLSAYATFQNSLNLIIVCDFVFRAISALKACETENSEAA